MHLIYVLSLDLLKPWAFQKIGVQALLLFIEPSMEPGILPFVKWMTELMNRTWPARLCLHALPFLAVTTPASSFLLPSSVQSLSRVRHFAAPWTAAHQASLPFTISQSLLKLTFIESVMPSNHLILCHLLSSCIQSLPATGSFPMSQFFASGGQSIGASASALVLPMDNQDWFPLGLTGSISLQSKGL